MTDMKEYEIKCRHGVTYKVELSGSKAATARTIRMLEDCCCYVCYNRDCNQARTAKQECKNECELFTKSKYCKIKED